MYSKIKNPITGKFVNLKTKNGIQILNNYLNQSGGRYLSKGSYKCVFTPTLKCLGEDERYRGTSNPTDYVSAVMTKKDAEDEIQELNKILPLIDPHGEYTIQSIHSCKLGNLDSSEEPPEDFERCGMMDMYSGEYPYQDYRGDGDQDLVQLIFPYGGKDLSFIKNTLSTDVDIEVKYLYINFISILQGIKKMKDLEFIHGDIKPPNILYNKITKKYYLIDFGLSKKTSEIYSNYVDGFYFDNTIGARDRIGYRYWPPCAGVSEKILLNRPPWRHQVVSNLYGWPWTLRELNLFFSVSNINDFDVFMKESTEKFDVYSLSFIISEFLNTDILLSKLKKQIPTINILNFSKDLNDLNKKMKIKNPIDRLSIEETIIEYNVLIKKYFFVPDGPNTREARRRLRSSYVTTFDPL